MLVILKINAEKAHAWNKRLEGCIKDYGDNEGIFDSWLVRDNHTKKLSPLTDHPIGFYTLSARDLSVLTNYELVEEYYSFSPKDMDELRDYHDKELVIRDNYGVCDNYIQILKEYPELETSNKLFVVSLSLMNKDICDDWRWCKWGKYIGEFNPVAEYLRDEPNINEVILYHIYEIKLKG